MRSRRKTTLQKSKGGTNEQRTQHNPYPLSDGWGSARRAACCARRGDGNLREDTTMSNAFKMTFSAATIAVAIFGSCLTASSASAADWNWVSATPDRIPADAVVGGWEEGGEKLFICRANYNGTHPGKVRPAFKGCNITYAGEEKQVPDFQVLVSSWVPASNGSCRPSALVGQNELIA